MRALLFGVVLLLGACSDNGSSDATAPLKATPPPVAPSPPGEDPSPSPAHAPDAPDASAPVADAGVAYPCAPAATAGHQEIDCADGVHMDVEISPACAAGGCGIIVDVHGFTMTADELDTHTRMRLLAPPLGYVVVQPTAAGLWGSGAHDALVWSFVLATASVLHTNPDRLHFMGFSQGAIMTFHMLCAHADAIASIAPASGNGCFGSGTSPSVARPILYVQGTDDNIQPWVLFGPPVRDAILAAASYGPPATFASGQDFSATRWTTSTGVAFEFWQHSYSASALLGGHCLPVPNGTGTYRCRNAEFDYSVEVLRFFGAHPRGS